MELLESIWNTAGMLAPYLLVGLALSGILHVLVPSRLVRRFLSGSGPSAVVRAALVGIPLPLCSCGIVPVAQHLRRDGASRGATATFLATTPSTGLDSILATWGMLGPVFAVLRVGYALVSGVALGWLIDAVSPPEPAPPAVEEKASGNSFHWRRALAHAWDHGFGEILLSLRKWLLVGIVLGGVLSWMIPSGFIEQWAGHRWLAYLAMLLASGPLYVCATGSIPVAAVLVAKGISPGAALVFLAVGPATNPANVAFIGSALGRRAVAGYLAVVVASALGAGLVVDWIGASSWLPSIVPACHTRLAWWEHLSAAVLFVLMLRDLRFPQSIRFRRKGASMKIQVPSISCGNCARHVTSAVKTVPGIDSVSVDVATKTVEIGGHASPEAVLQALEQAEYPGTLVA